MGFNIHINLAVVLATITGEMVSQLWQSDHFPWGRTEERYLVAAICADFVLAVILEWITSSRWSMRKLEDALWLSVCVTLVYAALAAPHIVYGPTSLFRLGFICLHKFVVVLTMNLTMFLVRKYV